MNILTTWPISCATRVCYLPAPPLPLRPVWCIWCTGRLMTLMYCPTLVYDPTQWGSMINHSVNVLGNGSPNILVAKWRGKHNNKVLMYLWRGPILVLLLSRAYLNNRPAEGFLSAITMASYHGALITIKGPQYRLHINYHTLSLAYFIWAGFLRAVGRTRVDEWKPARFTLDQLRGTPPLPWQRCFCAASWRSPTDVVGRDVSSSLAERLP